jgi:hypothetical protein
MTISHAVVYILSKFRVMDHSRKLLCKSHSAYEISFLRGYFQTRFVIVYYGICIGLCNRSLFLMNCVCGLVLCRSNAVSMETYSYHLLARIVAEFSKRFHLKDKHITSFNFF